MRDVCLALVLSMQATALVPQSITQPSMSRIDAPREVVVRSEEAWTALWREHDGDVPAPAVDFTTSMVVAVFLGSRPTGGYGVAIIGARREGDTLIVQWRERRPGPDMMTAQVMTSPAHLTTVPRFTGAVRFEKVDP